MDDLDLDLNHSFSSTKQQRQSLEKGKSSLWSTNNTTHDQFCIHGSVRYVGGQFFHELEPNEYETYTV